MHRISKLFAVFFCLTISGIFWVACKGKSAENKPRENPPTVVDVIIASLQPVTNIVEANGTVIANESVELRPETSGRLTYLNVPEGKQVAQGTVLARINSADLEAQLQKSKVQLELAQKTEERLKRLLDVQGINQSDYDVVVNQVNSLKADIAYTQTLIDKTVIRAPFSGTIGLRQVSPGAYVSSATIIATIQNLGKVKIDFTLPEQYSDLIKIGRTVDVEIDAASDARQKATIIAIEPQANIQTRNLVVRALLQNGTANPGAFVKVYVGTSGNDKKAIMVPTNSIIPDDRNNQLILVKKGKASFVNVQTGLRLAGNVEITKGLDAGDTIVVTGVLFARPNSPLKVRSVKTLEQLGDPK
jgi:membrane fusion protein (multidrug efflux system)